MKPTDPVSLYNWEALTGNDDADIRQKVMEAAWKKNYKKK